MMPCHRVRLALSLMMAVATCQRCAADDKDEFERHGPAKPAPRRYKFEIDLKTPVPDLLPPAPTTAPELPPILNEDLAKVAEVAMGQIELPIRRGGGGDPIEAATAHFIAKINHLNAKEPDGFLKALIAHRADLRGLPFIMGKDCRTEEKQAQIFAETVPIVDRQLKLIDARDPEAASVPNEAYTNKLIWGDFPRLLADKGDAKSKRNQATKAELDRAAIAALTQMLDLRPQRYRALYAQHLATIEQVDATRALARLALFAPEESVRQAAIAGLKDRPARDYAQILMRGMSYPLPAVSKRAAAALVELQCRSVLADLVAVLDQPDPRAPQTQRIGNRETPVVRELVRVNHQRNCLLCHAPANTVGVPAGVLTAPVTQVYYGQNDLSPDIFVRIDMTYLRQDFSLRIDNERFDFLVRTRELTTAEADDCRKHLARQGTPPSHAAAQLALRELTGQQPADTRPQSWRKLLNVR